MPPSTTRLTITRRLRGAMMAPHVLVTVVALLAASGVSARLAGGIAVGRDASPVNLYVSAATEGRRLLPLDPSTLRDLPNHPPLDLGEDWPDWTISADGSSLVQIEREDFAIVVRDGPHGAERLRFRPPVPLYGPRLSHDGSRLVASISQRCGPDGCSEPVWYVFDTRDGRLVTKVEGNGDEIGHQIDPSARRLYRAYLVDESGRRGHLAIAAHDLTTGAGLGRLELADVRVESGFDGRAHQLLTPAVALSPDGTRLVVVHADADAVTLIDAEPLTVTTTRALSRPPGWLDRLWGLVPLAPRAADAKALDGRVIGAVFAPDGRRLYVYGSEGTVRADPGQATERGLGLKAIEVDSGEIVAEALGGEMIEAVLPAPDGRDLYVLGPTVPWTMADGVPSYRLRRLDARTLDILAEREFPAPRSVVLVPLASQAP